MVIPVRDNVRSWRRPRVTYALIVLNVIVFLFEVAAGPALEPLLELFAVIPAKIWDAQAMTVRMGWPLITLITAMFLHGSWMHLFGNMLYLWIFGDNVEDRLGHRRYLVFYLLSGITGNLAHVLANPTSTVPTIGASGAVAGVLGGYLLAYPWAKVLTLVPLGLFVPAIRLPAWVYLGVWFIIQLFSGLAPIWVGDISQTVAFWAHIVGFLSGVALMGLWAPRGRMRLPGR